MGGVFGWFLVIVGVLAVFNAEKLPALRQLLEEKFKGSLDVAKESSKTVKSKLEQVKTEIDSRKNTPQAGNEPEENTPEETAEALQFMSNYINKKNEPAETEKTESEKNEPEKTDGGTSLADMLNAKAAEDEKADEEKPVDLNKFD